jgi:hypothetical protein
MLERGAAEKICGRDASTGTNRAMVGSTMARVERDGARQCQEILDDDTA